MIVEYTCNRCRLRLRTDVSSAGLSVFQGYFLAAQLWVFAYFVYLGSKLHSVVQ